MTLLEAINQACLIAWEELNDGPLTTPEYKRRAKMYNDLCKIRWKLSEVR